MFLLLVSVSQLSKPRVADFGTSPKFAEDSIRGEE